MLLAGTIRLIQEYSDVVTSNSVELDDNVVECKRLNLPQYGTEV